MTEMNRGPLVPAGAAFFALPTATETRSYAFVLVPGFTLLAFASAVEPLRIANQISQQPLYRWSLWSEDGASVPSSSGIPVGVEGSLPAFDRATKVFVCAGNQTIDAIAPEIVAALHRHHRHGGTVGGICTGAVALASAGLLAGRRFTLHWENVCADV
jgi:AraC family carnitine catabolism transcriptional activator